jgi:predicted TPR repeat methyltransferase
MSDSSLPQTYFDDLYERHDDPWDFATSAYEDEKYARTLSFVPAHVERGFEIGCSIGVFTRRFAPRCASLTAIDISERAVAATRERCAALPQVRVERCAFPTEAPDERFDTIVLSEVAYYWSDADLALARDRIAAALETDGTLVLVHFLPKVPDYVRDGDAVHEAFLSDARFRRTGGFRAERYRIDSFRA